MVVNPSQPPWQRMRELPLNSVLTETQLAQKCRGRGPKSVWSDFIVRVAECSKRAVHGTGMKRPAWVRRSREHEQTVRGFCSGFSKQPKGLAARAAPGEGGASSSAPLVCAIRRPPGRCAVRSSTGRTNTRGVNRSANPTTGLPSKRPMDRSR